MNFSKPAFRLSPPSAARLSFVLCLGLTGAATLAAAPALYAQQSAARSDLAIQTDVLKALSSYPDLSGEHITATTKNGVVTLAGTASSSTAKSQAQVVAATVDGVQSVVNNVTIAGGAASQADAQDPADRNQAQDQQDPAQQEPVQQAQSTDPNQQQVPYTPQAQPKPGASGQWGQAGPPPDAQNGQIPAQPQDNSQQSGQTSGQEPMQDPGQDDGTPPLSGSNPRTVPPAARTRSKAIRHAVSAAIRAAAV